MCVDSCNNYLQFWVERKLQTLRAQAVEGHADLSHLPSHARAQDGAPGRGRSVPGAAGAPVRLRVPPGVLVHALEEVRPYHKKSAFWPTNGDDPYFSQFCDLILHRVFIVLMVFLLSVFSADRASITSREEKS